MLPIAAGLLIAAIGGGTAAVALSSHDSTGANGNGAGTVVAGRATGNDGRSRLEQRASRDHARSTATSSPSAAPGDDQSSTLPETGDSGSCVAGYVATGTVTASGEKFNPDALTGANLSLPFNTKVRITNAGTGKSVTIRINDRGPYAGNRCFDLTSAAYQRIAPLTDSEVKVTYLVVS